MSIIEKAVSKLDRQAESLKGSEPGGSPQDTVQRAAAHGAREVGSAAPALHSSETAEPVLDLAAADKERAAPAPVPQSAGGVVNLPFEAMHAIGILTPGMPRSQIADEFRTIKRPLLKNIEQSVGTPLENGNLVMVTSAIQGEGKTFTSISLAISIAMEMDRTVLFIDADTAKASAGDILGVPAGSPGLIDLLESKDLDVADVLLRTSMPKLTIIPAGNVHEHANELLASEAMHSLMQELSQRYPDRVIVFDSPPLLLTTEAGVLASFMGQIVFVVAADKTPQQAVKEAIEHIGEDKAVGVVLNRARRRRINMFGYGYSYGYGYGYGNGGGYGKQGRQRVVAEHPIETGGNA